MRSIMLWTLGAVLLAQATLPPVLAGPVLLITDPNSSTKPATLLEYAVVEELQRDPEKTVLTLAAATPKQARAERWMTEAKELRQSARQQFDQLELDVALKQYTRAIRKLDKAMPHVADIRPLIDTLKMLSATYLLLGQERKARTTLERLLVLDLDVTPDESFNPTMMAVFDAVASRVRGSPSFDVEIKVDPPAAAVFFDGRLVGASPVTVKGVRRGRHYVIASLKGFEASGRAVELKPRASHSIALKLSEATSNASLEAQSAAAIAAMSDAEIPSEAAELLTAFRAERAILLSTAREIATLVAYEASGSGRHATTSSVRITDLASARRAARELLGPLIASDTRQVAAAPVDDEEFSDGFGEGGDSSDTAKPSTETAAAWGTDSDRTSASSAGFHLFSPNPTKERVLYAAYGSGVLFAAAGGVFGYLGLASRQEYYRETKLKGGRFDPDGTTDQVEGADVAKSGRRKALIADLLYGAAGVAVVTGLLLHFFWEPTPVTSSASEPTSSAGLAYAIGPGFLRIDF